MPACRYGRHRSAFQKGGYPRLQQELAGDVQRLWIRNLARDDRLVADHGRCAAAQDRCPCWWLSASSFSGVHHRLNPKNVMTEVFIESDPCLINSPAPLSFWEFPPSPGPTRPCTE